MEPVWTIYSQVSREVMCFYRLPTFPPAPSLFLLLSCSLPSFILPPFLPSLPSSLTSPTSVRKYTWSHSTYWGHSSSLLTKNEKMHLKLSLFWKPEVKSTAFTLGSHILLPNYLNFLSSFKSLHRSKCNIKCSSLALSMFTFTFEQQRLQT